jgi:glycosyltransferase involved in cell wall biosynthesis
MLYNILLPAADHVFVQSEEMKRAVSRHGVPLSKMTPVPMGIKASAFTAPPPAERVIPAGTRSFVYLGAVTNVRRLDLMIRVLAEVRKEMPDVMLYIVGGGDDPAYPQTLIDEAGRLGVRSGLVMVGQLPQMQALRYVQDADVCVSPIYPSPILDVASPTKLIEYMALGKPVVANDHPEQRLVIDESGAGYWVPWDDKAFAEAILKLLRAPEQAREMGERGRRYALQHRTYRSIADVVEREMLKVTARPLEARA